jgi:hypothetical protein
MCVATRPSLERPGGKHGEGFTSVRAADPDRIAGTNLFLPVAMRDVRPVEHILSPFVGLHDDRARDSDKQDKQSYFDNHFEPPAMGGLYRFWQEHRSAQATY